MRGLLCFFSIKSITYSNEDETQEKKTLFAKEKWITKQSKPKKLSKINFLFLKSPLMSFENHFLIELIPSFW